jgi:hypothetical protein
MEAETSRGLLEDLLTSFLSVAVGLNLLERIEQPERLPTSYRRTIESLPGENVVWVAWRSAAGVVAATGRYDLERSHQVSAHALLIEWRIAPNTHHVSWWRSDPNRAHEWTAGRGCGLG